ncbi:MAG: hypothetical protein AB7P50_22400, partial [Alphaproteobacteria bacterium]
PIHVVSPVMLFACCDAVRLYVSKTHWGRVGFRKGPDPRGKVAENPDDGSQIRECERASYGSATRRDRLEYRKVEPGIGRGVVGELRHICARRAKRRFLT